MDWVKWHEGYEGSPSLAARLDLVRTHIANCLDTCPDGPIRVLGVCAGDGRDLIGALVDHQRARDVEARLVELNRVLIEQGQAIAQAAGLTGQVQFVNADATISSTYKGMTPAHLVLLCGVLGNIGPVDTSRLIEALACLCRTDGFVIWTRSYQGDGARQIVTTRELFRQFAFKELCFDITPEGDFGIATHRYLGEILPLPEEQKLFEFTGPSLATDTIRRKLLRRKRL